MAVSTNPSVTGIPVDTSLFDWKQSCRVATTANIALSGEQTIDGIAVVAGNRVLVKDQAAGAENGIYVCATGAWARAIDADTSDEVTSAMLTFIEEGTANADEAWLLITNAPITLGTTNLTFSQITIGSGTDHGALSGLTDDDHSQYFLLAGRAGGQTGIGGTGASENLSLQSTAHATRGNVRIVDPALLVDQTANADAAGEFQRNGANITFHDGTAARNVTFDTNTQTLTNKTLTTPVIGSFANAAHNHQDAAGGGQITSAAISGTTGSGNVVLATSPTIVTPVIGSFASATHSHQNAAGGGTVDHGLAVTGLTDDDHTQYALLLGRSGGQSLIGGTASANTLTLTGTSHGTPGDVILASSLRLPTVSKTTTYTATAADCVIRCDTSGAGWTLTLPAAASIAGRMMIAIKTTSDTNALTIDGNASETIDGATTYVIRKQYESLWFISDGTNWHSAAAQKEEAVLALRATNQSISTGVLTAISYTGTDIYDQNGMHDPSSNASRLTARSAGKYYVYFYGSLAANATGARQAGIRKNGGAFYPMYQTYFNPNPYNCYMHGSCFVDLAATDYVEHEIYHEAGISLNYESDGTNLPIFGMVRIRA